jgi:hypothetical protein
MSLLFAYTRNHALLALVIQEATPVASQNQTQLESDLLQILLYFIKAKKVPMKYRFDFDEYRPVCGQIWTDITALEVDRVITNTSVHKTNPHYVPGPRIDELLKRYPEVVTTTAVEVIRDVITTLVPLSPEARDEVLLLDYLYREQHVQRLNTMNKSEEDKLLRQIRMICMTNSCS